MNKNKLMGVIKLVTQIRTFDGGIVGVERAVNEWLSKYSDIIDILDIKLSTTIWEDNNGENINHVLILYKTKKENISIIEGNQ